MKKLTLLIACLTLVAVTGCTTATKTGQSIAATIKIPPTAMKVDYDINTKEKKSGTASAAYLFGFIKISGPSEFTELSPDGSSKSILGGKINKLRLAAVHNALAPTSGERLIDPQYECQVVTYPFWILRKYSVTAKGYEATIRDIQQVKN